jgi:hypothetical protein
MTEMKPRTIFTDRIILLSILTMAGSWLLVCTGAVQAASDFTGCVTPGGTIIAVAPGPSPLRPCEPNQTVIHIDGRVAKQAFDVHWNPLVVCEALWQLGEQSTANIADQLEDLGCPSHPDLPAPSGQPLVKVLPTFDFDEQNLDAKNCGILKIEQRPEWGPSYHWVVDGGTTQDPEGSPGGVVFKEKLIYFEDADDDCYPLCESDDQCIAAQLHRGLRKTEGGSDILFWTCRTFHYNDNVDEPWHELCAWSAGLCVNTTTEFTWWIRDCTQDPP